MLRFGRGFVVMVVVLISLGTVGRPDARAEVWR